MSKLCFSVLSKLCPPMPDSFISFGPRVRAERGKLRLSSSSWRALAFGCKGLIRLRILSELLPFASDGSCGNSSACCAAAVVVVLVRLADGVKEGNNTAEENSYEDENDCVCNIAPQLHALCARFFQGSHYL